MFKVKLTAEVQNFSVCPDGIFRTAEPFVTQLVLAILLFSRGIFLFFFSS